MNGARSVWSDPSGLERHVPPPRGVSCVQRSKRLLGLVLVCALSQLAATGPTVHSNEEGGQVGYDPKGHRDPFVALVRDGRVVGVPTARATETLRPVLYGILWDPAGRSSLALLNDKEAKVGEQVGAYRVEEIRQDAVVLTREDGEPVVLQVSFETPEAASPPPGAARAKGWEHP